MKKSVIVNKRAGGPHRAQERRSVFRAVSTSDVLVFSADWAGRVFLWRVFGGPDEIEQISPAINIGARRLTEAQ